jgi:transcriptional regulator with XRE-family HTH domain
MRTTRKVKTMNFIDVLNAATTELSDNKLSQKLGISRQSVSLWRTGETIPKDEMLEKLAEISGIPVEKVLCAAYADKIHNPIIAELLRNNSHLAA